MTSLQPLLVAAALGLAASSLAAAAVRAIEPRMKRESSALWAAMTLAPLVLGVLAVVALLSPGVLSNACHCAPHGDHHPHLCWIHPASAAPLVTPALLVLGVALLLRGSAIARTLQVIWRASSLATMLGRTPTKQIDGIPVHVLDCAQPVAFTAGLASPRIVLDRTLVAALDAASLRAVVHHEHAHALRRDGLTLAVLRLAAACFPARWLRSAIERWTLASEAECDRHAAAAIGSAADVAAALVAVERLHAGRTPGDALYAPAIGSADLERRVRALLESAVRPASLASDVVSVAIVAAGLMLLSALWPGDTVHHLAETLLGHVLPH